MQRLPVVYATRKISLRSEAARDFVALAGWAVEPPYDDFSYAGDLLKNRGFVVSRFWHPAARFTFTPQPDAHPEDRLMLIVVAEGELVVETSETRSIVPAGSIFLARPESLTVVESTVAVSCSLVTIRGQAMEDDVLVGVGVAAPDYLSVFSSVTNALLARPIPPSDPAFNFVEKGVAELVAALITASHLRYERREKRPGDQIYFDAITLIVAQASNPATTVETIARDLGISRSHLFRAFRTTDHSPSAYLRNARAAAASALLDRGVRESTAAEQSGFGTVRRMRRALRET